MTSPPSLPEHSDYQKLRELMLGKAAAAKLDQLSQDEIAYIADLISEAITTRGNKDDSLSHALAPIIDSAFDRSIRNDPHKISDVFFPIIGPAIRKSVSAALFDMVQSLNKLLEQSLSLKNLGWRFKAWRAGQNYAEYVLLKTLEYRVEQVFLIHRETGILIDSVVAPEVVTQDPDLVSSMLTAINDFVSDSFDSDNQSLEWLKFGELTLQIRVGPKAIMAIAVRGSGDKSVTEILDDTLEKIHDSYYSMLAEFDGDKERWQFITPIIEACLVSKTHDEETKKKKNPWLALSVITIGLAYFGYYLYQDHLIQLQEDNVIRLVNEPNGYFYISHERKDEKLKLTLIRDQSLTSFTGQLENIKLENLTVELNEIPLPLNKGDQMLPYIHSLTKSPSTLTLEAKNGVLILSGKASESQIDLISNNTMVKQEFKDIDSSSVEMTETNSQREIKQQKFQKLYNELNGTSFLFKQSLDILNDEEQIKLSEIIKGLKDLYKNAKELNQAIEQLILIGSSDKSGSRANNEKLSLQRAKALKEIFLANGLPENDIIISNSGTIENSSLSNEKQRQVIMMVYLKDNLEANHEN